MTSVAESKLECKLESIGWTEEVGWPAREEDLREISYEEKRVH